MKSTLASMWNAVAGGGGATQQQTASANSNSDPSVPPAATSSSAGSAAVQRVVPVEAYVSDERLLQHGRSRLIRLATLSGHQDRVWAVAWHPSGDVLASCSGDKTIKLWSRSPHEAIASSSGIAPAATTASPFDTDEAAQERRREEEEARSRFPHDASWKCIATLEGEHGRTIRHVAWSPDGNRLAAASFDATVSIWRRTSKSFDDMAVEAVLDGHDTEVKHVAWDRTGRSVATCARDKMVQLWEDEDAVETTTATVNCDDDDDDDNCATAAARASRNRDNDDDDAAVAEDSNDDEEEEDEALDEPDHNFECTGILQGHSQDVKAVCFHPDSSKVLVSCGYDDTVKVWEESANRKDDWHCTQTLLAHQNTVWAIAFQPAAAAAPPRGVGGGAAAPPRLLASADGDGRILVHRLVEDDDRPAGVAAAVKWTTAGSASGAVHEGAVFSIDWCPALLPASLSSESAEEAGGAACGAANKVGTVLAACGADDSIAIYETRQSAADPSSAGSPSSSSSIDLEPVVVRRAAHAADVNCVMFAPRAAAQRQRRLAASSGDAGARNSHLLATASDDGTVTVWRLLV